MEKSIKLSWRLEENLKETYVHRWADSILKRYKFFHKLIYKMPYTSNPNPSENFHVLDTLILKFIFRINKITILKMEKEYIRGTLLLDIDIYYKSIALKKYGICAEYMNRSREQYRVPKEIPVYIEIWYMLKVAFCNSGKIWITQ